MTLVEVVIAIALAGMLSAGMYASAIYTMRQTAKNIEHIFAVQLASSEAASLRASRFDKLITNPTALPTSDFEKRFAATKTVKFDSNHTGSQTYTVKYLFSGFGNGIVLQGSGPNATLWLPQHSAPWTANQFKDHFLVVTSGSGVNQVMRIVSNQASATTGGSNPHKTVAVNLTSDLSGVVTNANWKGANPSNTSQFGVDYGLYCNVEVTWDDGAGYKTVRETVYVPASQ